MKGRVDQTTKNDKNIEESDDDILAKLVLDDASAHET